MQTIVGHATVPNQRLRVRILEGDTDGARIGSVARAEAMLIKEAIARLRQLHEKRKQGSLSRDEAVAYQTLCDEFYGALAGAQRPGLHAGEKARQTARVAAAKKIELVLADGSVKTMTYDVGIGGFAALVPTDLPVGSRCDFVLTAGGHPLRGHARVVNCIRHGSGGVTHRASFSLETMSDDDRAKLEVSVIDAALLVLGS
jgi:hypothetical protein